MRNWRVLLFCVLTLTACKMGPDYTRPAEPVKDGWRLAPTTSESLANLQWWELLEDEELQKLIRIGLQENLDLRTATANIEQYHAQLVIAKFDLAPDLTYTGKASAFRTTDNVLSIGGGGLIPQSGDGSKGLSYSFEQGDVGISWEIDLWGKLRRSIEATQAQLLSKVANQRAVILELVSNLADAYFDLRTLDLKVEITKRTLSSWVESVRLSQLQFKHGDVSKLDVDRFEAERASTAAQLASLERDVIQKENEISLLLGRRPTTIRRGRSVIDQPLPPSVPPGLPSDLLERRPDILEAEQNLVQATANIGVAQAERFPQLDLTGSVGGASVQLESLTLGPFATFSGGGTLTGPLLNATVLGYQVKSNEAQAQAMLAEYDKTVLTAFKEVEDALIAVQKVKEQLKAQGEKVVALQSSLRLADSRYQGGRSSYLDLLTAQRDLFEAELDLADTRGTQLTSVVDLYKALGGGWSPTAEQAAVVPNPGTVESAETQAEPS